MTDILKNIIEQYSLWWQSYVDYGQSAKIRVLSFSTFSKVIRDGMLLFLVILPAAILMLKQMYGNSVGYIAFLISILSLVSGDLLFFSIITRVTKNPARLCYQHPFITTVLYCFICYCMLIILLVITLLKS